jgi:hypothetical protein
MVETKTFEKKDFLMANSLNHQAGQIRFLNKEALKRWIAAEIL